VSRWEIWSWQLYYIGIAWNGLIGIALAKREAPQADVIQPASCPSRRYIHRVAESRLYTMVLLRLHGHAGFAAHRIGAVGETHVVKAGNIMLTVDYLGKEFTKARNCSTANACVRCIC
jgi:hypothetical protein